MYQKVGSGEYYFPPPECINNVSGKIEWNLTSAQIKVKKEEQKKLKKEIEEGMRRKYDNETDVWPKSYQSTVQSTTKTDPVLSPEDSVHFKKVQLPLLDVAQKSSLSGNYSFLRKFHSIPLTSEI